MSSRSGVRHGWTTARLDQLFTTITDGDHQPPPQSPKGVPFIVIGNICDGSIDFSSPRFVTTAYYESLPNLKKPTRGDLLYTVTGSFGIPLVVSSDQPFCVQRHIAILKPAEATNARYVAFALSTSAARHQATTLATGTAQKTVGLARLRSMTVPVAPTGEQQRIVDALESLLSRLDNAVASLERARAKLKAYRASVLKAAVEGRLVPTEAALARVAKRDYEPAYVLLARILKKRRRRWEKAELARQRAAGKMPKDDKWKAKYKEPVAPDTAALPELPEGWCWARLEAVSDVILGQQRSPAHAAAKTTVPYIRAANITWAGLDLSDVKRMGFVNPDRHRLDIGDVLLSEASGSPMEAGKPAIWRSEIPGACFQNTVLRVRPLDKATILPEFLRLVFLRDCVTGQFARLAPGVGIVHIGAERLAQWSVPLVSLPEQRRIVEEVERVLSVADQNAVNVEHDIKRCVRLRQAVLKWAFEGKLVDQDPTDEPAAKLLARIRAQRTAAAPTKKANGRRRKGAA